MIITPILATPTTLITGFLGAGKTTLINQILSHKPTTDKWALLINEFGQIGIDGSLIHQKDSNHDDGIAIKEVSGGCICCTSQLPLQIALVRLLAEHSPVRLIIEPTGLAHADELTEQLSAAHWQTSLTLTAIICVLSAAQWKNDRYRSHEGYMAHVRHADIVLYNRSDLLDADELANLKRWVASINPAANLINADTLNPGTIADLLATPHHTQRRQTKISLAARTISQPSLGQGASVTETATNTEPPYRYHETHAGYTVGGWRLPSDWLFDGYALQKWLLSRPDYLRIKGVIATDEGWLSLNITPESINISDAAAQTDSKLELIFNDSLADEAWMAWDEELMDMVKR